MCFHFCTQYEHLRVRSDPTKKCTYENFNESHIIVVNAFSNDLRSKLFSSRLINEAQCLSFVYGQFSKTADPTYISCDLLSGSFGSLECLRRNFSGEGVSTFVGPMVLCASLLLCVSCLTWSLNFEVYLNIKIRSMMKKALKIKHLSLKQQQQ